MLTIFTLVLSSWPYVLSCSHGDGRNPYGPPKVSFPADEGSHPDCFIEWWYGNFTLADPGGHRYGAMVAYFRPYLRIISISDIDRRNFYHDVSLAGGEVDYARGRLDLKWGSEDHWWRTDPVHPVYRLESKGDQIALRFDIVSEKPPFLVGGDGLIGWTDNGS